MPNVRRKPVLSFKSRCRWERCPVQLAHTDLPDFRALFEAAPGLYLVLSPSFTIVGASDSYLRATLTKREDILQRGLFEVFPDNPDDLTANGTSNLRASLDRVLRDGLPDTMAVQKYDIRRPEAAGGGFEERYWSPVNSPVFGLDRKISYVIHRVEDVTELVRLKQNGAPLSLDSDRDSDNTETMETDVLLRGQEIQEANRVLRAANEQLTTAGELELRALFDFMPQLGWTAQPDGFIDFYNRRWYEYTGTTYEQMQGWGWKTVHDPEMLPAVLERWQDSLRLGTTFEMEYPLRRHDGSFRCFLNRISPIRDAGGTIVRWVGINTDIHDQKQAALAGEELRATILRNMAEGVCLVRTSDYVIVNTNPKFDRMLGYQPGELSGKPVALINRQGEAGKLTFDTVVGELNRNGEATYEVPLVRKDGGLMWCRAHTSRLEHPTFGTVWVAIHEDITQRKETVEERDNFFEMSGDLLCIGSLDGCFKRLNPAWERTLGWTREEMMSKVLLDFVHPDDRQATSDAMSQGLSLFSFENRYRCRDGTYRWFQWRGRPIVERSLFYAAARDVTESRAAKVALQELSESLETTLLSIGDGVIATDVKGAITRMNPVAERLTGWALAEAMGRPFAGIFTIVDEDTRSKLESPIERSLRDGATVSLGKHTRLIRKDGSEVAIADSCAPIRTADGTVNGSVLVFRDLTAERNASAVQAKYQQQLVFSDRMASVGTLAAGVAHEINNPLTYITANIDTVLEEIRLLSGGSASGRLKDIEENLVEARTGATRVARIVRGLKTFSRIEEERRGVVDLVSVLELSINMAFNEIRHRAHLVKDFGKVPLVDADDARLGQVFINLLVNAAQAFPEGSTDANEIRIVTSTDAKGCAVTEVRDTGPGMAPALLAHIFDPFFTTKPVGIGTGLGLAICHNIVTGMGGEISVESELGRGTTFRVVLPASGGVVPLAPKAVKASAAMALRPATVLVVDDEPAVGLAVRRVLKGHEVAVFTTAQEALDVLATGKEFDVILSDLMMPKMSGIEFHAVLARLHPKMASRVVFVTGGAFTAEANAFLDRVTNERMEKPFDLLQLREMVQKFVKGAQPAAA
jgi:PAS domain S-box-containing protein